MQFDPHDPRFEIDGVPFDVLEQLRRESPVYRTPRGSWYLSRYADIEGVLKEVDTFRADLSAHSLIAAGIDAVPPEQLFLSEITEPRHGKIRRLFNSCFAAHRAREVEPFIRAVCDELIDNMAARDVVDLHGDYALPIPGRVMAHVMGLGTDAADLFMQWSMDGSIMLRPASPGMGEGGPPIQSFFTDCLAAQRALPEPDNHVFKVLMEAVIDDEPLTDREIVTQLHFMIQAGVHTTRTLLTHLVHRPLHDPGLFARLRNERELIPRMVEESLRHDSPVQRTTRRCTRDSQVGGTQGTRSAWLTIR